MGDDPLSRLADIDLPTPPDWQPLTTALGAAAVLAAAVGWLMWRLWRRHGQRRTESPPGRRAVDRVDAVRGRWEAGEIDDREASYRLASALRLGLGLDQLDARCPPGLAGEETQWGGTVAALGRLRYEPSSAARLRPEDFARIRQWLIAAGHVAGPQRGPS